VNGTNDGHVDVCMVCVHVNSRTASAELSSQLGIECITDVIRRSRLRWSGHVEGKDIDHWFSACTL